MKMLPILCAESVVRNFLNSKVGAWPAEPIDPAKPFQWQDRRPLTENDQPKTPEQEYAYRAMSGSVWLAKNHRAKVGDVFYVRENVWDFNKDITDRMLREGADTWPVCIYSADMSESDLAWCKEMGWRQRPSIHMPKELSRIHLEVMRVRVEQACDISEADAIAEGCRGVKMHTATPSLIPEREFHLLWEKLYGHFSTDKWCWVYDLKRIK